MGALMLQKLHCYIVYIVTLCHPCLEIGEEVIIEGRKFPDSSIVYYGSFKSCD